MGGGWLKIQVPHFSCGAMTWIDPTHKRAFTTSTFYHYLTPEAEKAYYTSARFQIKECRIRFEMRGEFTNKRSLFPQIMKYIGKLLEYLANRNRLSQIRCERYWAHWLGFEELYVELITVK